MGVRAGRGLAAFVARGDVDAVRARAGAGAWTLGAGCGGAGSVPSRQAVNIMSRASVRRLSCSQSRIIAGQSRNGVRARVDFSSERMRAHRFMDTLYGIVRNYARKK